MSYSRRNKAIEYIILANALVFFIFFLAASTDKTKATTNLLWTLLALQPATVFVKPWTIITSMFVHANLGHIFFNMVGLLFFGTYLERLTSEKNMVKIYFIGGIFANLLYAFMSLAFSIPNPMVMAVGASGAISAVLGALIILRPNMTIYFNLIIPMPLWVYGVVFILWSTSAGIAFTAHLGGLIAGLAFGRYLKKKGLVYDPYSSMYGYRQSY